MLAPLTACGRLIPLLRWSYSRLVATVNIRVLYWLPAPGSTSLGEVPGSNPAWSEFFLVPTSCLEGASWAPFQVEVSLFIQQLSVCTNCVTPWMLFFILKSLFLFYCIDHWFLTTHVLRTPFWFYKGMRANPPGGGGIGWLQWQRYIRKLNMCKPTLKLCNG